MIHAPRVARDHSSLKHPHLVNSDLKYFFSLFVVKYSSGGAWIRQLFIKMVKPFFKCRSLQLLTSSYKGRRLTEFGNEKQIWQIIWHCHRRDKENVLIREIRRKLVKNWTKFGSNRY
uniref:Uncharacterized protein n=1 Tax=Cacopsylla melanoneura TaxID=428564 RepID=A0A8D8MFD5_9HEMI